MEIENQNCNLECLNIIELISYESAIKTLLKWYEDYLKVWKGKPPVGGNIIEEKKYNETYDKYKKVHKTYLNVLNEIERRVINVQDNE